MGIDPASNGEIEMTAYDLASDYRAAYHRINGHIPYIEVMQNGRFKVVNHHAQSCVFTAKDIANLIRIMKRSAN